MFYYFIYFFLRYVVQKRGFWPLFYGFAEVWLGEGGLKIHLSEKMQRGRISNFLVHLKLTSVSQCI